MYLTVVIGMQNSNALIALAQVSQNANNPYSIFSEYIKFCVFVNTANTMTLTEVRDAVSKEFGLYLPHNIIVKCLSHLQNEGVVSQDNHQIKRTGTFDTESFEKVRSEYRTTEHALIDALINYVAKYNRTWYIEYAREQLIKVLDSNGIAYDIFLQRQVPFSDDLQPSVDVEKIGELLPGDEKIEVENVEKQPLFTDDFFVGKFVEDILNEDSVHKEYLLRVCEGLMLCVGTYQLPDANTGSTFPQINGTGFFFDTRLLLRFIGCAGEAAVEAAGELVKLIQDAGGNIYYYPQVLEEMNSAFDEVIKSLSAGYPPRDEEMRLYAIRVKNSVAVITAKKASLQKELLTSKIYLKDLDYYSDADRIRFGFDWNDLQQYMCTHLQWDSRTIENDAWSIWETHMCRQGSYREYCGTQDRLSVFVTTNSRLIQIALAFRGERPNIPGINGWKRNRLPVITDIRLTCRLWSPATQGERLSLLYLTANAVAAQRPTQRYFNSIRELAIELEKNTPAYAGISLTEFFDDNVTDMIFEQTQGLEDNLNLGTFASSIEEIAELKAKKQEEITNKVVRERDDLTEELDKQTNVIIEGAIEKNINTLGVASIPLRLILWWPMIATTLFAALSAIISYAIGNWHVLWIALIPCAVAGVEKFFSSKFITKWLIKYILPKVEKSFENQIIRNLRQAELPYKDNIIEQVKVQTVLLTKCRSLME